MGVSGRLYAEATLTQKIEDWCASHVRCLLLSTQIGR